MQVKNSEPTAFAEKFTQQLLTGNFGEKVWLATVGTVCILQKPQRNLG